MINKKNIAKLTYAQWLFPKLKWAASSECKDLKVAQTRIFNAINCIEDLIDIINSFSVDERIAAQDKIISLLSDIKAKYNEHLELEDIMKDMKPEQALEIITNVVQSGSITEEIDMALAIAQKAIKKQIPVEPDYEGDGYDENGNLIYDYAKCPICEYEFEYGYNDWGVDHCPCGQKLDWRNNE